MLLADEGIARAKTVITDRSKAESDFVFLFINSPFFVIRAIKAVTDRSSSVYKNYTFFKEKNQCKDYGRGGISCIYVNNSFQKA
jgi:hypothetical protein